MSEKEKKLCQSLAKALNSIPESRKEYFLGFAEGVEARKAMETLERITGKTNKSEEDKR